jgi:hypothetical protein
MIEIIVSIVLMSVVAIIVPSYIIHVKNFSVKAENYSQATEFLVQQLETLAFYDYTDAALNTATNPHDAPLPASALRDKYGGTRSYVVTTGEWSPGNSSTEYKQIVATVAWNDGSGKSLSLRSLMRKQ